MDFGPLFKINITRGDTIQEALNEKGEDQACFLSFLCAFPFSIISSWMNLVHFRRIIYRFPKKVSSY